MRATKTSKLTKGRPHTLRSPRRVVICGGGVAGIEALLALRAHIQVGVEVHLVAPNRQFVYQPLAVAAPFGLARTHHMDLASIAREQNARLHVDLLARVDTERRLIQLADAAVLPYDALIVAVGARRRDWLQGALHFAGAADVAAYQTLLEQLERSSQARLSFVAPRGVGWTLPLYELALLTASHLADRGVAGVELAVVTSEADPLEVFGPAASRMLRTLLAKAGIALKSGSYAEIEHGELHCAPSPTLGVDHVVTLARLDGPAVRGLPRDESGFIAVDEFSRVVGLDDVYAAGDGTTSPIKQGGIATQQADAAAETIAAEMGAAVVPAPLRPTLRAVLLTGIAPTYLRARLAGPTGDSFQAAAANPLWLPPSKIAGRYLAPYLAGHNPLTRGETLQDRPPSTREPARLRESHDEARELALISAERDAVDGDFKSALQWLEVLERLDGVLPYGYLQKRADWQNPALE